jgi:hypothetical protein
MSGKSLKIQNPRGESERVLEVRAQGEKQRADLAFPLWKKARPFISPFKIIRLDPAGLDSSPHQDSSTGRFLYFWAGRPD